ncbi:MAG: ribose-phosphate pyrophosphokinase [Defluviitaleaceae bacterium]|nr:ribose-phosphate pyrophosphokinase [Defluviitaleaceae bacterium]
MRCSGKIKIISGNSNPKLAEAIASSLDEELVKATIGKFADGEISVNIHETVRGCDVFIIQSTSHPVNDHLMELLIIIDAMKRASAGRINVVMPYYGYARQDRKAKARDPISAKLVANLIDTAGADRLVTMDLHSPQLQGFFDIPVDHLVGLAIFKEYYENKFNGAGDIVVVAPDMGSTVRARYLADAIGSTVAIVDKKRDRANESKVMNLIGDVKGKKAVLIDDLVDTGGSIINAANAVLENGATEVHIGCTHGVFSKNAIELIENSDVCEMIVLDTIAEKPLNTNKIIYLSAADNFANAIRRIHDERPVSDMFTDSKIRYQ